MPISAPSSPSSPGFTSTRDASSQTSPFPSPSPFTKRPSSDTGSVSRSGSIGRGVSSSDSDSDVEVLQPPRKFGPAAARPRDAQPTPVMPPRHRHNAFDHDDLAHAARFRVSIPGDQLRDETVWLMRQCLQAGISRAADFCIAARHFGTHTGAYRSSSLRVFWSHYKHSPATHGPGTRPANVPEGYPFASFGLQSSSWDEHRLLAQLMRRHPRATVQEFIALAMPQIREMRELDVRSWYHTELRPGHYPRTLPAASLASSPPRRPVIELDDSSSDEDVQAGPEPVVTARPSTPSESATPSPCTSISDEPLDLSLPKRHEA